MDSNQLVKYEKKESMRIFACMNPSFEVGKKELPESVKNSFTKIVYKISNEFNEIKMIV